MTALDAAIGVLVIEETEEFVDECRAELAALRKVAEAAQYMLGYMDRDGRIFLPLVKALQALDEITKG